MDAPATQHLIDFIAVIDHGGLSAAARALGRAQAAVTYSIQSLERDLGVVLFDRTSRPLAVTEEGAELAAIARDAVQSLNRLQFKAGSLRAGVEGQVKLVVDALMPMTSLIPIVRAFAEEFPAVNLEVAVEAMTSPLTAVLQGSSSLGIAGPMALEHRDIVAIPLVDVMRVAVAAPCHPLADLEEPITYDMARRHRQVMILNRDQATAKRNLGGLADQLWRTSDMGAKREMLLGGIAWGNMPLHLVEGDIVDGRLVRLNFSPEVSSRWDEPIRLHMIRSSAFPPGIAADWLFRHAANLTS
jgi:DNA-binding transcriptional LysR family regulator